MRRYKISKRMVIAGSHCLKLTYSSPCAVIHGHNWVVVVTVEGDRLNQNGMLVDFGQIKALVHTPLDHHHINEMISANPTAENIARWISDRVQAYIDEEWMPDTDLLNPDPPTEIFTQRPIVTQVEVEESEGNKAWYHRPYTA